VDALNIFTTL